MRIIEKYPAPKGGEDVVLLVAYRAALARKLQRAIKRNNACEWRDPIAQAEANGRIEAYNQVLCLVDTEDT